MRDSLRLVVGTLTVLRVAPPTRVDRRSATGAMLLAPLVGLLLGAMAAVVLTLARFALGSPIGEVGIRGGEPQLQALDLLGAVLALTALALATRAIHLDGLADTADALGSGRTGVGRAGGDASSRHRADGGGDPRPGPAGPGDGTGRAAASAHHGTTAAVVAVTTGRLALLWTCRRGVPAARPDGLARRWQAPSRRRPPSPGPPSSPRGPGAGAARR